MAASFECAELLQSSEFSAFSEEIREKIRNFLSNRNEEIQEREERFRVDSEQKYFELEKKLIASNKICETSTEELKRVRKQLSDLETKYHETTSQLHESNSTQHTVELSQLELKREKGQLQMEKDNLCMLLERRDKEIDRLSEECRILSEKLSETNAAKFDSEANLKELQSRSVTAELREQRFEQEKENLQQQVDWLNEELRKKMEEGLSMGTEQAKQVFELQSELAVKTEEVKHFEEANAGLKETNEDLNEKLETQIQKLKEAGDMYGHMEEKLNGKICAQSKLLELYKESADENEKKVNELEVGMAQLQTLLQEAKDAMVEQEKFAEEKQNMCQVSLTEKDECIQEMKEALKHANELLELAKKKGPVSLQEDPMTDLSISASAAGRLIKSGLSITQIYHEYVTASQNLKLEQEENERLSQNLDRILREIEDKAPLIKKQREEAEQIMETNKQLSGQLDNMMVEVEKLRVGADDALRKQREYERENHRLTRQSIDLSQQVRMLLKELEEARGTLVHFEDLAPQVSSGEVSSSSQVITDHLVTFRSIEELQDQNQKLLEVVRELSEKAEEEERRTADSRTAELKQQLEKAMEELEEMRSARERQAQMVNDVIKQRDMCRDMTSQPNISEALYVQSPQTSTPMVEKSLPVKSPGVRHDDQTVQALQKSLIDLQTELRDYKDKARDQEKELKEHIEGLMKEKSDQKMANVKLTSQLEYAAKKQEIIQVNTQVYKKEIAALKEKNLKYVQSISRHEQTIAMIKQELKVSQETKKMLEEQLNNLRVERDTLRQDKKRYQMEHEVMVQERRSQSVLMLSLQDIQSKLERAELETKAKLGYRIDTMERENQSLNRRLEESEKQQRSVIAVLERELIDLRNQREAAEVAQQEADTQGHAAVLEVTKVQQKLAHAEAQLQTAEARLSSVTRIQKEHEDKLESAKVKDLQLELEKAENKISGLQEMLEQAQQNRYMCQSLADGLEQNLQQQGMVSEQYKAETETRLQELIQKKEDVEQQLVTMETEIQKINIEKQKIMDETENKTQEMQEQIEALRRTVVQSELQRNLGLTRLEETQVDLEAQTLIAKEAQEKYQQELISHAASVEALNLAKQQLEGFDSRLADVEEKLQDAEKNLTDSKSSWSEQDKLSKAQIGGLERVNSDLRHQNELLHNELQQLSEQKDSLPSSTSSLEGEGLGPDAPNQQMLEIVRFLRKEKELAESKMEAFQVENIQQKQQLEQLKKKLENAMQKLKEEIQRSQVVSMTTASQSELMMRVENMNLLTESNRLLREEKQLLSHQLQELKTKALSLEQELHPLQETNRQLQVQLDSAQGDCTMLKMELENWKARTNSLIEHSSRADPEEYKRVVEEKEALEKQAKSQSDELIKQRNNLKLMKEEVNNLKQELSQSSVAVEAKNKELEDKNKTMNKLREIARKYKSKSEEVQIEMEQLKSSTQEQQQQQTAAQGLKEQLQGAQNEVEQLKSKMKGLEKSRDDISEQLGSAYAEKTEAAQRLQQVEARTKKTEEELTKRREEVHKLQEELTKATETKAEMDRRQTQLKNLVQSAKNRMTNYKDELAKLNTENAELKNKQAALGKQTTDESELRFASLKSQYDAKVARLEKEKTELQQSQNSSTQQLQQQVLQLMKERDEMAARASLLERALEGQQQKPSLVQQTARPRMTAVPAERAGLASTSEAPKTASIRPMASPSTQPHSGSQRPTQRASSAEARALASIRPMAVATATTTSSAATPTATVMPTTVTTQEATATTVSVSAAQTASRPRQQVQPLSPHTEPEQDTSAAPAPEPGPSGLQASKRQREEESVVVKSEEEHPQQKRSRLQEVEIQPVAQEPLSLEADTATGQPQEAKAQRGSHSQLTSPPQQIRAEVRQEVEMLQQAAATAASQPPVKTGPPETQMMGESNQRPDSSCSQSEMRESVSVGHSQVEAASGEELESDDALQLKLEGSEPGENDEQEDDEQEEDQDDDDESVVILQDDDIDDEDMGIESLEVEQNFPEEMEGEYEESGEYEMGDEEYQDVDAEEGSEGYSVGEEEMQQEEEDVEQDEDVIIVEDEPDENESAMASQDVSSAPPMQPASSVQTVSEPAVLAPRHLALLSRVPARSDRVLSATRTQPTPFMLGVQSSSQYDDGDDSIVPSTPTLFVPRRSDGFAEAVSSPQVPHGSFFSGMDTSNISQSELAQLGSQAAMRMDDTRMDLSQLEEGGGRGIPSTTLQPTPPTISITEAPQTTAPLQTLDPVPVIQVSDASSPADPPVSQEAQENSASQDLPETGLQEDQTDPDGGDKIDSGQGEGHLQEIQDQKKDEASDELQAGTSSGSSTQQGHDKKHRIQRIVWEEPGPSHPAPQQPPAAQPPQRPARGASRGRSQTAFRSRPRRGRGPGRGGWGVGRGGPNRSGYI